MGLSPVFEEFSRRNGIEPLRPDDEGRIHFTADDVEVVCFERFGRLHLVSPLGPVPEPDAAGRDWIAGLLRHALKRMKHGRATPALTGTGDAVLYASCRAARLSVHELEARIEEHVNASEQYRRALESDAAPRPTRVASPAILRP